MQGRYPALTSPSPLVWHFPRDLRDVVPAGRVVLIQNPSCSASQSPTFRFILVELLFFQRDSFYGQDGFTHTFVCPHGCTSQNLFVFFLMKKFVLRDTSATVALVHLCAHISFPLKDININLKIQKNLNYHKTGVPRLSSCWPGGVIVFFKFFLYCNSTFASISCSMNHTYWTGKLY